MYELYNLLYNIVTVWFADVMLQYLLQLIVTKTIPSHRTEEGHALLEVPGRFDWKQRSIPDQAGQGEGLAKFQAHAKKPAR